MFAAVEKSDHHKTVADLLPQPEPPAPGPEATPKEVMAHRLKTTLGKMLYKLRKQTVEPVLAVTMQNVGACLQAIPRVESPASRLLHRLPDGVMFTSDGGIL